MQRMDEDTHICYAILRGKSNQQLFEEEAQKMKILDVAANIRKNMEVQVLAYCVLDNELHLVIRTEKQQDADRFLNKIVQEYEARCFPNMDELSVTGNAVHEGFPYMDQTRPARHFRKNTMRELKDMKAALRCCLKLHLMPVRRGIVASPEDYWWCSYSDYMGRAWLPVTTTWPILGEFDENPGKAVKLIKRQHIRELEKQKI